MKYNYNYGFLQQWLDANKHIPRGVINEAFATSSNNRIKAWARGERAMPVLSILRFCNSFQVPLSAFFRNEDAEKDNDHAPMPVKTGDKIAPHGGYAKNTDERKRGERKAVDPTEVTVTPLDESFHGITQVLLLAAGKKMPLGLFALSSPPSRCACVERKSVNEGRLEVDVRAERETLIPDEGGRVCGSVPCHSCDAHHSRRGTERTRLQVKSYIQYHTLYAV